MVFSHGLYIGPTKCQANVGLFNDCRKRNYIKGSVVVWLHYSVERKDTHP